MAEGGSSTSQDPSYTIEHLHRNQAAMEQRVENLTMEFQRFAAEMRREIRSIKGNRNTPPATIPANFNSHTARAKKHYNQRELRCNLRGDSQYQQDPATWTTAGTPFHETDSDDDHLNSGPNVEQQPIQLWIQNDPRLKLDVACFDGHLHIEDYLDWEHAVEAFFDYMDVAPDKAN